MVKTIYINYICKEITRTEPKVVQPEVRSVIKAGAAIPFHHRIELVGYRGFDPGFQSQAAAGADIQTGRGRDNNTVVYPVESQRRSNFSIGISCRAKKSPADTADRIQSVAFTLPET